MMQDKGHGAECQAFVEAVRRGGAPPIPYESLAATTRATFAVLKSLATGQPVVNHPGSVQGGDFRRRAGGSRHSWPD